MKFIILASLLVGGLTVRASTPDTKFEGVAVPEKMPSLSKPVVETPQVAFPSVVLCQITTNRYVISDSDGFDVCSSQGGKAIVGKNEDRALLNVKSLTQKQNQ